MDPLLVLATRFGVALGIGLLIGAERERHKRLEHRTITAGLRTITLVALAGAIGATVQRTVGGIPGAVFLAAIVLAVTGLVIAGYWREGAGEPGMTTEVAELVALLLGVLAMYAPDVAAALAVIVTILLVARSPLHTFVTRVLSEHELQDALLFLAATLVVLPLLPQTPVGPFGVFVPSRVWEVALAVMAIGAAGHVAMRTLGPDHGLPVVGLASGFVSSVATIAAMGVHSKEDPALALPATAGATLSNVATVIQLAIILALADVAVLQALLVALVPAGLAAAAYGGYFTWRASRHHSGAKAEPGRAFDPRLAVVFALTVTSLLFVGAVVQRYLGSVGTVVAAGLAGFADTHSISFSIASLAGHAGVSVRIAVVAVLVAFTANNFTKAVAAYVAGGPRFFARIVPGLLLVLAATWAGALAGHLV